MAMAPPAIKEALSDARKHASSAISSGRAILRSGILRSVLTLRSEFTVNPERKVKTERSIPLRRIARPEEIAELACFLASDKASFIAGGAIAISGALDI